MEEISGDDFARLLMARRTGFRRDVMRMLRARQFRHGVYKLLTELGTEVTFSDQVTSCFFFFFRFFFSHSFSFSLFTSRTLIAFSLIFWLHSSIWRAAILLCQMVVGQFSKKPDRGGQPYACRASFLSIYTFKVVSYPVLNPLPPGLHVVFPLCCDLISLSLLV